MYCSSCGNSVNENLNYCNICGAKIGRSEEQIRPNSMPILSIAVGFFGIAGLFGFIVLLKILLESRLDQSAILIVLIVYLIALFMICSVIVGNIWRYSANERKAANQTPEDYAAPKQVRAVNTNQLEGHHEPVMSVADHTTRTFDKIPQTKN